MPGMSQDHQRGDEMGEILGGGGVQIIGSHRPLVGLWLVL